MNRRQGLSLIEMLVALALGGVVIAVLGQFLMRSSKETTGASARAARDGDYALASGAIQKMMPTSFRFMGRGGAAGSASVRLIIPLIDQCRDLTPCPGAVTMIYAVPRRRQNETWPIKQGDAIAGGDVKLSLDPSLEATISASIKPGDLLSVFVAPFAPLFYVRSVPAVQPAQLIGDTAPQPYLRFDARPFELPNSWFRDLSSVAVNDFNDLNRAGAGLLALQLYSVGPQKLVVDGVERWNFGSRACTADAGLVRCDGAEMPSVFLDSLDEFSVAASWRRPISPIGVCTSEQTFWDLASRSDSSLPLCPTAAPGSGTVRFEVATTPPVPHVFRSDENLGDVDPRGLSLVKFEMISTLRFKLRLARPYPRKPEGADNPIREVTFHVQFQ